MVTRAAPAPTAFPTPRPVRTGLLATAEDLGITRWGTGGIAYEPLSANQGVSFDPCATVEVLAPDSEEAVTWVPWGHAVASNCFAGSTSRDDQEARAQARYDAQVSHLAEEVFWTGQLDDGSTFEGNGWPNRALAHPDSDDLTTGGPIGIVPAFREVFEYLAGSLGGLRGIIHVPYHLLPYLAFYGLATRVGNSIVTSLADHLIVAGTGYPGTAPDGSPPEGGSVWIYATSMVRADASPGIVASDLSREGGNNNWEAVARGLAVAEWDLQAHGAIQTCIPDPGPACEAGVS